MFRTLLLAICAATLAACHGPLDEASPAVGRVHQQPATGTVVVQPN